MKALLLLLLLLFLTFSQSALANSENETPPVFSDAELAQILAPIALYPDSVLSHLLIAATYPLEVVQAARWLADNLDPERATAPLADQDWDASVKALTPFPDLIERLNDDLDWTRDLGDAFLADEKRLLASVQALRAQAKQADSFEHVEHIQLSTEQGNIIIEPADSEVVYIPYYDSHRVYGDWLYAGHPPYNWLAGDSRWHSSHANHLGLHRSPFDWRGGIYLSTSFFFNTVHWSNRRIRVANHHSRYWRQHSRRHTFDRYQHRRQLLSDSSAGYWRHNPKHRRGVAYAGQRQHSNRFNNPLRRLRTGPGSDTHWSKARHQRQADRTVKERRKALTGGRHQQTSTIQRLPAGKHRGEQDWRRLTPRQQREGKHLKASTVRMDQHRSAKHRQDRQRLVPSKQREHRTLTTERLGKHRSEQYRAKRPLVNPNRLQKNQQWQTSTQRQAKHLTSLKAASQQHARAAKSHKQRNLGTPKQASAKHRSMPGNNAVQRAAHKPQLKQRLAAGHHRQR